MPLISITSLDDARVAPYRNLRDAHIARGDAFFIAEGRFIVERLFASPCSVASVLVSERQVDWLAIRLPADVPAYVASDELIRTIVGFDFHRGVLACGRRPATPTLDDILTDVTRVPSQPLTLIVCPETNETENLGSIMRLSAGFGVDALLLGERCCDPFSRRAVRVSMGAAFDLPIRRSSDLASDLKQLRDVWNVTIMAAICDPEAEPLHTVDRPDRIALMLGSEAHGLDDLTIGLADRRVTIPMHGGTDSLNVAMAAAICLYHFRRPIRRA